MSTEGGPARPEVGIGIVGYGMMGKAHSYGYTLAPHIRRLPVLPRLRMISGRNREAVQQAADLYGVQRAVSDWREVIASPEVEIVDICTPPGTHPEIVVAAAAAGKAIICEKPLAADYAGRGPRRRRRAQRQRPQRDRLQLSPPARAVADEADDRRGRHRRASAVARNLAFG